MIFIFMLTLKSLISETVIPLTQEDAQEVHHKLRILADTPDLQMDYGLTQDQANALVQSIPKSGGQWIVPPWAWTAVQGEMADHIEVLQDIAMDAFNAREQGQALRISKQAKRLKKLFGV